MDVTIDTSWVFSDWPFDHQKGKVSRSFDLYFENILTFCVVDILSVSWIHVLLLRFADKWAAGVSRNSYGIRKPGLSWADFVGNRVHRHGVSPPTWPQKTELIASDLGDAF